MKVILLGPPGAGKGTQSQFIASTFHIPIIATGDMLRNCISEGSTLGLRIQERVTAGHLVPDEDIIALVQQRLAKEDCQNGFLLDGFPRTLPQATALERVGVHCDHVIYINAPDEVLIERGLGRWIHPASGRVYHQRFHPPREAGRDDITGEPLVHRSDDTAETLAARLKIFRDQTGPVVDYYRQQADQAQASLRFAAIDGLQAMELVRQQLENLLSK